MSTCETCKYWKRYREVTVRQAEWDLYDSQATLGIPRREPSYGAGTWLEPLVEEHKDEKLPDGHPAFGECNTPPEDNPNKDCAFAECRSEGGIAAQILTSRFFGCNLHEPGDPSDQVVSYG